MGHPMIPLVPADVWEQHKNEIRRRYQTSTLSEVKRYMESHHRFPIYSLSTWKKKIGKWGFDNKHNKASDIHDAIREKSSTAVRNTQYLLPDGRAISKNHLQKYLKRSKKLLPDGSLKCDQRRRQEFAGPTEDRALAAKNNFPTLTRPKRELDRTGSRLNISSRSIRNHHLLQCLRHKFLFGQGWVRPAELGTPTPVRQMERFLGAIERCGQVLRPLRSYPLEKLKWPLNCTPISFLHLASRNNLADKMHVARKLLFQCVACLKIWLQFSLLHGIQHLLAIISFGKSPEYFMLAKTVLAWSNRLIGGASDADYVLQNMIAAVQDVDKSDLQQLSPIALRSFACCLERHGGAYNFVAADMKMRSIREDPSLTKVEKTTQLNFILDNFNGFEHMDTSEALRCFVVVAREHFKLEDWAKVEEITRYGLEMLKRRDYGGNISIYYGTERLFFYQSRAKWRQGNLEGALRDMEEASVRVNPNVPDQSYEINRRLLMWKGQLGIIKDAENHYRRSEKDILNLMTSMEIEDSPSSPEEAGAEMLNDKGCCQGLEASAMEGVIPTSATEADWQRYKDGEAYGQSRDKSFAPHWRTDIAPAVQETLFLTEPQPWNGEMEFEA